MSTQLHSFITNVLKMPHYANDAAGSGVKHNSHEDALTEELVKVGYVEIVQDSVGLNRNNKPKKIKRFPKLKRSTLKAAIQSNDQQREIAKLVNGMNPGDFIRQPCGSQSFPDFLVCDFSGNFVLAEAKSGGDRTKGGRVPAWNDSLVKQDAVYIFSSGFYNKTTVFLGQDVLDHAREQVLNARHQMLRDLVEETKAILDSMPDPYNRGFNLAYARPKFEQGGGNNKVDYFAHSDRKNCEQNVLKFALEQ